MVRLANCKTRYLKFRLHWIERHGNAESEIMQVFNPFQELEVAQGQSQMSVFNDRARMNQIHSDYRNRLCKPKE